MSFREWKEANGIGRKTHTCRAETNHCHVIQPGDAIHCRRAETEQWLNKEPARYVEPLPPDFPGVRLDDATLKPREHAVPESTTGQNAFLKACLEFLICDDSTPKRICRGMGQLEAMRHAGFARLGDSPEFRQLWCGEPKPVDDNFNTKNLLKLGAGSMTDHPWRFREIHQVILNPTHIQKVINLRSDSLRRQSGVKSYRQ